MSHWDDVVLPGRRWFYGYGIPKFKIRHGRSLVYGGGLSCMNRASISRIFMLYSSLCALWKISTYKCRDVPVKSPGVVVFYPGFPQDHCKIQKMS